MTVPAVALRIALGPDLASEMVLAGPRVIPTRLTSTGYRFHHPDVDAALAAALAPGG
jgi:hypothetical protein